MKYVYPAIFTKEEDAIIVRFPDLDGCMTYGDDINMAHDMACEALTGYLESVIEREMVPKKASDSFEINCPSGSFVSLISCNVDLAKQTKSVKKTLTIPAWLNELAINNNINFSQLLQEALMSKLRN